MGFNKREQFLDQLSQFSSLITDKKIKDTGFFINQEDINDFLNHYQKKTTNTISDQLYLNQIKELFLKQYSDKEYLKDKFNSLLEKEFALYRQFNNFSMGKHIAMQSAMNCEAFNNINGVQQRADFFTSYISGENISFISNYIMPDFGKDVDCSVIQNTDGSISVKKTIADINTIVVEYDSTHEYNFILKHNELLSYFQFNNKFFVFYNKNGIDHTFKTMLNKNIVIPKKISQFFVPEDFKQNITIQPLNLFKNFNSIKLLNDFYCEQNGQFVSENITLKYGPYKKSFMFEDKNKFLNVKDFVLSSNKQSNYSSVLQKNDQQVFGNVQYDSVKGKYFSYILLTKEQLLNIDTNKFIIESQEETEIYNNTTGTISSCFLQKVYKNPILIGLMRKYNDEYEELKAIQALDKFQTFSKNTTEQQERQIIQKKYKQNKYYPVLFSTAQFVKSSQFNITGLDSVLHTVKSFCSSSIQNPDIDSQSKVVFEIDQTSKSIFVQDEKFKIEITDQNIRKDLQSVIQYCEYTKTDDTTDTFISLINPQNLTETINQQNKRFWSFQVPITTDVSTIKNIQYIHIYVQKTEQVQPIPQDGIINFGFMNKPIYRLWIVNSQYSEVPVQIVYRQQVFNNFIDFRDFSNMNEQLLIKINEITGTSNKFIFFCEQQEEFSISREAMAQTFQKDIVSIDNIPIDSLSIDNSQKIIKNNEFYLSYSLQSIFPNDHFCKKEQSNKYIYTKLREMSQSKTNYLQDSLRCFDISFDRIQIKDKTAFTSTMYIDMKDKNSILSSSQNKYNVSFLDQCTYTNKDGQLVQKQFYKLPYFESFDNNILYEFTLNQNKDKQFVFVSELGHTEIILQQEQGTTNKKYVLYLKKNQDLEPVSFYVNNELVTEQNKYLFDCLSTDKITFVLKNFALKGKYALDICVNDVLQCTMVIDSQSQSFVITKQLFDINDSCSFECWKNEKYSGKYSCEVRTDFVFSKEVESAQYIPIKNFLIQYNEV